MILCDIGNTFLHFYRDGCVWKNAPNAIAHAKLTEPVYYISVNPRHARALAKACKNAYDIGHLVHICSDYEGLGVDRKAACLGLEGKSGAIIDAGSAITVDLMEKSYHCGGAILPGLGAWQACYKHISPRLNAPFNPQINLEKLPNNTHDALSYGTLRSVLLFLRDIIGDKKAYFTGGDGQFLCGFFPHALYNDRLVFTGLQRVVGAKSQAVAALTRAARRLPW